jgi:hypothetical protein
MGVPRIAATVLLAGCVAAGGEGNDTGKGGGGSDSGGSDSGHQVDHGTLESLVVEPSAVTLVTTRVAAVVVATGTWSDGESTDVTADCTWAHTDYGVAVVSADGVVHGIGPGETTATCQVEMLLAATDVTVGGVAPVGPGDVVVNELLVSVPDEADVNGDGVAGRNDEQFIELVNVAPYAIELVGAELWEADIPRARHKFGAGVLLPGEATVIFAAGQPSLSADRCVALSAYNDDGEGSPGLSLDRGGDVLWLLDATGAELLRVTYDGSFPDGSMVLSPELDGTTYADHLTVPGSIGAYSPCTLADGAPFPTAEDRLAD